MPKSFCMKTIIDLLFIVTPERQAPYAVSPFRVAATDITSLIYIILLLLYHAIVICQADVNSGT
jgi:hypothetical protein